MSVNPFLATGTQNDYKPQDFKYPQVDNKLPIKKTMRIVLESKYKSLGTLSEAKFVGITIPDDYFKAGRIKLYVEDFIINTAGTNNLDSQYYKVIIPELQQALSYDSMSGSSSQTILTSVGRTYSRNSSSGIVLQDQGFVSQRSLTVKIIPFTGSDISQIMDWCLVLTLESY